MSFFYGVQYLVVNADNAQLKNIKPADISDTLTVLHGLGFFLILVGISVVFFALLAWRGIRWAANGLFVLGMFALVLGVLSIFTVVAVEGTVAGIWSAISANLVRSRKDSRAWFGSIKEQRAEVSG